MGSSNCGSPGTIRSWFSSIAWLYWWLLHSSKSLEKFRYVELQPPGKGVPGREKNLKFLSEHPKKAQQYISDDDILAGLDQLLQTIHDSTRIQFWCCTQSVFIQAMKRFNELYLKEIEKFEWAIFFFGTRG